MKKSKLYFINLYRALSVAQWCVLVCAILTFVTGPEQLWLSVVEIVLFLVLLTLNILEHKRPGAPICKKSGKNQLFAMAKFVI